MMDAAPKKATDQGRGLREKKRSLRGRWSGRERRMLGGLRFRQGTVIVITCQEHASTRGPSIASVVHSLKERLGLTNMRYCNFAFGLRVHSPGGSGSSYTAFVSHAQDQKRMYPSAILRSGRSAWKGPFFVAFPNIREALANNTPIKTDARSCTILPNFVGIRFLVHNGKDYVPVMVTQDMVGHKLGEFSHTKKRFVYKHTKNK